MFCRDYIKTDSSMSHIKYTCKPFDYVILDRNTIHKKNGYSTALNILGINCDHSKRLQRQDQIISTKRIGATRLVSETVSWITQ